MKKIVRLKSPEEEKAIVQKRKRRVSNEARFGFSSRMNLICLHCDFSFIRIMCRGSQRNF